MSALGASPSPPAFLESAWQPVCPPGWVELVVLRGAGRVLLFSALGGVGSCRARAMRASPLSLGSGLRAFLIHDLAGSAGRDTPAPTPASVAPWCPPSSRLAFHGT